MLLSEYKFAHLFNMSSDILLMSHNIASTLYYKKEQARNDLLSAIGLSQYSQSVINWKKVSYSSTEALTDSSLQPVTSASSHDSSKILSDKQRVDEVSDEIKRNIRMAMIANSMGALSMIGSDNDINEDGSDRAVSDDTIITLRNNLLNAIDNEMMLQGNDAGQCYLQLVDCYTSVYNYMTAKLNGENGIDTVTLKQSEPAFVLAHDRYGDSTRADEIAQRNDVINQSSFYASRRIYTVKKVTFV